MNREQLEHVLRAAAAIAQENSLVVVGSQAVLLPYPNAPEALLGSREVDLYPALHPERADLIDGDVTAICPDIHDLAVSKCAAARDKDADFVRVLLKEKMIDANVLDERIRLLDPSVHGVDTIRAWARRRAVEAQA